MEHRSRRTRGIKAGLRLLACWALAPLVLLVPPHVPWALTAVLVGVYLAFRAWNGQLIVTRFEGTCPRCESALPIPAGTGIRLPHQMVCYGCHHQPVLQPAGG